MLIYKIFRTEEWQTLMQSGTTDGALVDLADGFIHFSTADQVIETATKHFQGETGLFVAAVNAERLGESLKWEPSRGGQLFPHLYRPLRLADLAWVRPFEGHQIPGDIE